MMGRQDKIAAQDKEEGEISGDDVKTSKREEAEQAEAELKVTPAAE